MTGGIYRLRPGDEIVVIDASKLVETDDPDEQTYTLLIELVDGRWLVFNSVTYRPMEAAWLMRETRREDAINLDDWTDVTVLRKTAHLDWSHVLRLSQGRQAAERLRPACPDAPELSQLQPGDSAHVMRSNRPGDPRRVWWSVMLHLVEGIWLQYLVPFDQASEAESLLRVTATLNAYVTDDFIDVTEEMEAVEIDRSEEVEIDGTGNRRIIQ